MRCEPGMSRVAFPTAFALAVLVELLPALISPAFAQAAQAAPADIRNDELQTTLSGNGPAAAAPGVTSAAPKKSLTAKAIDRVKEVAKTASDIFNRVPCLPPKGGVKPLGSLPHVASK